MWLRAPVGLQAPYGRASQSHAVYLPPTAGDRCIQKAKVGSCAAPRWCVQPHPQFSCPPASAPLLLCPVPARCQEARRSSTPPHRGWGEALTPVLLSIAWVTSPAPTQNFEDPPPAWILAGCPHAQSPPPTLGPAGFASLGSPQPGGKQGDYRMSGTRWASLGKQAVLGQPWPRRQDPSGGWACVSRMLTASGPPSSLC